MKIYLSYEQIHNIVRDLALRIKADGFEPDVIVAIGTGGFIPARIFKTYLNKPVLAVGISYYNFDDKPMENLYIVQWIDEVEKKLSGKKVLLVDEVDDSRATLEYCLHELLKCGAAEIAVSVIHNKRKEKKGIIPPEIKRYYIGQDVEDLWICYPWESADIEDHYKNVK